MWPFTKRPAPQPCFAFGQYRIDETIEGMVGLEPLSPQELQALNPTVSFRGERIVHAPAAVFMDVEWDTILATVDNRIYKIAIQWYGSRSLAGTFVRQIAIECTRLYGKGKGMSLWDASDGNIVLQSTNIGSEALVDLFATSHRVREFERIR